jgi:hypothetical protein
MNNEWKLVRFELLMWPGFWTLGQLIELSISPDTKMTYLSLLMWDGSSKIHFFIDFWHPFSWRLWRTVMLLLTKLKGHRSNFHYSGPQKALFFFKKFFLLSVRSNWNVNLCLGTPCMLLNTVLMKVWYVKKYKCL